MNYPLLLDGVVDSWKFFNLRSSGKNVSAVALLDLGYVRRAPRLRCALVTDSATTTPPSPPLSGVPFLRVWGDQM